MGVPRFGAKSEAKRSLINELLLSYAPTDLTGSKHFMLRVGTTWDHILLENGDSSAAERMGPSDRHSDRLGEQQTHERRLSSIEFPCKQTGDRQDTFHAPLAAFSMWGLCDAS